MDGGAQDSAKRRLGFPKRNRILRRSDFRQVYDQGFRWACPLFAAFCLRCPEQTEGPKIGFTVPRALGKAVVRNRIKRRMREVFRMELRSLSAEWRVVVNPRRAALLCPFEQLQAEAGKLIQRCANS